MQPISPKIQGLLGRRDALRRQKRYAESDKIREQVEEMGYKVADTENGF